LGTLTHADLTSKSGAGRYVHDRLDPRWNLFAREPLRLHEKTGSVKLCVEPVERGRDVQPLFNRLISDGALVSTPFS
jgi:hypothetical protein